jgi:hypothetical protein
MSKGNKMTENLPQIQKEKTDIAKEHDLSLIEQVVMQGDLSKLNPEQRVTYYHRVCESIGLNPYTRPFDYISLNGKLTLYAKKDATEQLRQVKKISITGLEGKVVDDLYIVTAKAMTPDGRIDQATGAVSFGFLKGDAKANAIMKAETKAKRRVTLSIGGLGWTDETEIESIPSAVRVNVDLETGVIEGKCEISETTLTLNEQDKPSTQQIDHFADAGKPIQEHLFSFDEMTEFMKLYALTNDAFKENFERHMQKEWKVSEFEDIPAKYFNVCMNSVAKNIEMQGMEVQQ